MSLKSLYEGFGEGKLPYVNMAADYTPAPEWLPALPRHHVLHISSDNLVLKYTPDRGWSEEWRLIYGIRRTLKYGQRFEI